MASGSTFTISSKYLKTERKGGRVKESHSLGFLKSKLLWKPFWRRLRKSPGDPGERRVIPFLLKQFSGNSPSVQGSKTKVYSGRHQRLYLRIFDRGSETQIWEHFRNQPVFPCQKVSSISPQTAGLQLHVKDRELWKIKPIKPMRKAQDNLNFQRTLKEK